MATKKTSSDTPASQTARAYLSQSEVPACPLSDALRVAQALADNYAGRSATPLQVASAMNMTPNGGAFRSICGVAIAYRLVSGGSKADAIALEALGKRIVTPTKEGDDIAAKREAILKPRVVREFLQRYSNAPLPRHDIALNVLIELGVPRDRAEAVYKLIIDSANEVGFVRDIKGKQYVDLTGYSNVIAPSAEAIEGEQAAASTEQSGQTKLANTSTAAPVAPPSTSDNRRVFITHGKNKVFIEPVKRLLGFGEMVPIVSVEQRPCQSPFRIK